MAFGPLIIGWQLGLAVSYCKRHKASTPRSKANLPELLPPKAVTFFFLTSNLKFGLWDLEIEGGGLFRPATQSVIALFYFDLTASFFKFLFSGVSIGLIGPFQYRLGGAFNQGLGFGQAEAGFHFAHGFNDGDLLVGLNR